MIIDTILSYIFVGAIFLLFMLMILFVLMVLLDFKREYIRRWELMEYIVVAKLNDLIKLDIAYELSDDEMDYLKEIIQDVEYLYDKVTKEDWIIMEMTYFNMFEYLLNHENKLNPISKSIFEQVKTITEDL